MALLKVNPTRVTLLALRKRLKMASKGHKLLKEKRDGLMKKFLEVVRELREVRAEVEQEMLVIRGEFGAAAGCLSPAELTGLLLRSTAKVSLGIEEKNVMSVRVPVFSAKVAGVAGNFLPGASPAALERGLAKLEAIFPQLLRLAELQKSAELLAAEIEVTRRRVNTLEYRMIPDLKETIRFIGLRLEGLARDALVAVMRVKAQIEAKAKQSA